jgi:serine/threonine-protein kinase
MYGPGALLANRYRLDERVGGGGMGEVWRATDQVLDRTVAVKVVRPALLEEAGFAERFLAEARIMATIAHRGVVAVHDYYSDSARAFLVMEHVPGEALSRTLQRLRRLDPARTMAIVAQAADALQAAHGKGVVHRDIKPGNLLVRTADDAVVLTDFGIARSAASTPLTATGAIVGTPSYLAPEQVLGMPASPRSDVYALGVVAYECLAGRRPFDGENPFEIAMKRVREAPPPLGDDLPPGVVAVVDRALAADPDQRWASAADLAAAARNTLAGDPTAAADVAFAPARAPVPVVRPAPMLPPTLVHGEAPPPASPRPQPVPWPPPPTRPPVVRVANLLLRVAAICLLVNGVASLRFIDDAVQVAEDLYGSQADGWLGLAAAAGLATVGALLLTAVVLLALAWLNNRGGRGARAWTFTLGVFALCCCGPCWGLTSLGTTDDPNQEEFRRALAETVPPWYEPVAGASMLLGLGALLVALVLLMSPPANRFFRVPPPVFYYPYLPYLQYPPRP